jgi:hypothetical protein
VNNQKTDVADEINYLGVTFESSGGWNRQNFKATAKANQTLAAIDKCLARTPDIRVTILEKVYKTLNESTMMYGTEIWGLDGGGKEIDKIHCRFCKIILGVMRFAANNMA